MRKAARMPASHHIVSIMAGERHRDLVRARGRRAPASAPAAAELRLPTPVPAELPERARRRIVRDPDRGRVHVSLDDELASALRARARREHRSVGEVAHTALREYVSR